MSERRYVIAAVIISIAAALIYGGYYWSLRPAALGSDMWVFNTPDEMANYFFSERLAADQGLRVAEPLDSPEVRNIIHPRSITVANSHLAPGSFLGFILVVGTVAQLAGAWIIPWLIPMLSGCALLCYFLLIRKHFDSRLALGSTILLATLPAFWYYSSRSLFNNVLFVDLIIIGLWQLQRGIDRQLLMPTALGSIFIGLALTVRTGDALWVLALVAVFLVMQKAQIKLGHYVLLVGGIIVSFIPILQEQAALFGSPFITGYIPEGLAVVSGSPVTIWHQLFSIAQQFIAPFGFHPVSIIYTLYHYGLKMFWWLVLPAVLAFLFAGYQWYRGTLVPKFQGYLLVTVAISVFISSYYGSWYFHNNVSGLALIGSSQVRYFLPVYILLIPVIVWGVVELLKKFRHKQTQMLITSILVIAWVGLSSWSVLWRGPESLMAVAATVTDYQRINREVRQQTSNDAVIITAYNDKVFFPKRRVITYWQDDNYLEPLRKIISQVPVYLYAIKPTEISYLKDKGFEVNFVATTTPTEALYQVK